MKLDILAIGAHPDDIELSCSGTLLVHIKTGYKVGILDLTKGELGTRGTPQIREEEAREASRIMGIHARESLDLGDGFFQKDRDSPLKVVSIIRKYSPEIVVCNAVTDRHPDHGRAASLVSDAVFLSGLSKVETELDETVQKAWKVKAVYHSIQDRYIKPDFIIDVTSVWEQKMKSIRAFGSQFYNPDSGEPETPISSREFLEFLEGRALEFGRPAGVRYAEGFTVERTPAIRSFFDLY
jgi:N-acetylglucosamine malate deacetylase 1